MSLQTFIAAFLIFFGSVVMVAGIISIIRILGLSKNSRKVYNWKVLLYFAIFFLIGYVCAFFLVFNRHTHYLPLVTGLVFFMGAIFVFLVAHSSSIAISELLDTMVEKSLLEKEVHERKKAEEAMIAKNREILEYTHAVTHDLKKPLTAIKIVNSMGQSSMSGVGNERAKEVLKMQEEAVNYMQEMLEDLLMYAKLETGTQELAKQDIVIKDVVDEVVGQLGLEIREKGITVSIDANEEIYADRKFLKKIFMNLIGNAINYMGEPLSPGISVGAYERENRCVCFVRDNGVGIPDESKDRIFDKFQRGNNVTDTSGSGLGLTIVRQMVYMHGGEVWFESKPGEGTTFFFAVPLRTKEAGSAA